MVSSARMRAAISEQKLSTSEMTCRRRWNWPVKMLRLQASLTLESRATKRERRTPWKAG